MTPDPLTSLGYMPIECDFDQRRKGWISPQEAKARIDQAIINTRIIKALATEAAQNVAVEALRK